MKLSVKIFLGICIPALIAIISISGILIDKSFNTNLDLQLNLYIQEFRNISTSIENSASKSDDYLELVKFVSEHYKTKNIYLAYYEERNLIYTSNEEIVLNNIKLLDVDDDKYNAIIQKNKDDYYAFITLKTKNNANIVYIRDLNSVYEKRQSFIKLCIEIVCIFIVIITLIAYVISKTLTRPLLKVSKEMSKLSSGTYDISLKEGKDEVGLLIKEFNKMSKELEKRNKDLLELVNSKQLFIDNLSHEMNTPLTSILGYSTLLENAILSDEQKIKYLRYIEEETKRISEMYKKLLVISYKENNNIDKNKIKLDELIDEVIRELDSKLSEHNIKVNIQNNLSHVYGDKLLISLALSNLIRNAINASEDNSIIIIRSYHENNKSYICVIDTGSGIEEEQIAKIVEPFYRVDKARSRKNGGAGLGLSIVTRVMQLHNGSLKIKSKLGEGSTFILVFND